MKEETSKVQPLEKKKLRYAHMLFGMNSLKEGAMCHVDSLLGNDRKISNYTTAIAKEQYRKQACFHGNKRIQQ
jgi:hypothetical protein